MNRHTFWFALVKCAVAFVVSTAAVAADRPIMQGIGEERQMFVVVSVVRPDGQPAEDYDLVAKVKRQTGREVLESTRQGSTSEIWVPIGGSRWFYVELSARSKDGKQRASQGIPQRALRQAAIDGVVLQLAEAERLVSVTVNKEGQPVSGAHVTAQLQENELLQSETDDEGLATFRLLRGERLDHLTAWTDDRWIGGYSFDRKPRRDPLGTDHLIELEKCRAQTIRFLDAADDSPVPNLAFGLIIGTGEPNYNFVALPDTFPHCSMTTDDRGEAICRWFPDWERHGAYVEIVGDQWARASEDGLKTADDGALLMKLKPRVERKLLAGKVKSDVIAVGGLLVEVRSFQGEEEHYSDHLIAFTDKDGNFSAPCIPGATYCVCVDDSQLVSNTIDLIPYDPDSGKSHVAELTVSAGAVVEARVTSGANNAPMSNVWVYFRALHDYSWYEDGEQRHGSGGRSWGVYTDQYGVARTCALAGSRLEVNVYAGEWRSDEKEVTVNSDGVTTIDFHRAVDEERIVKGRVIAPPTIEIDLSKVEVTYGSIDGETDEEDTIHTNSQGHFELKSKAMRLGFFAYSADGAAAGVAKAFELNDPIEVFMTPTCDLQGQLLGHEDQPIANHGVRVEARIEGERKLKASFSTSFSARTFETVTDSQGMYTLSKLPSELDMTLRAASLDGSDEEPYLDDFFLIASEERPRLISRLDRANLLDTRPLSEKYEQLLRDTKLGHYHLLVTICNSTAENFVGRYLMDREKIAEVPSFMNLMISERDLEDEAARQFVEVQGWPQLEEGKVFVCALDGAGIELGRLVLELHSEDAPEHAADFVRTYAPPQEDAFEKWDAAFLEAKQSGRKVWARVSGRYCGPCFRLSRWLDDQRELLERDYVLVKIDEARDLHWNEVAQRIVGDHGQSGIPFHAIFSADEKRLIDSEGPTGNIGHPSSFEGRVHLQKMLSETKTNLSDAEIEEIVATLDGT